MKLNTIKLKEGAVLTSLSDGRKVYKDVLNATYNLNSTITLTLGDLIRLLNTEISGLQEVNNNQDVAINQLNNEMANLEDKLSQVCQTIKTIASAVDKQQEKLDDDLL